MSEPKQCEAAAVCRMIVRLRPSVIDEEAIRAALGDIVLTSMSQVAQAFGVSADTVRHTWRRDGMPGEAKRGTNKANKFLLAEILIWWLKREVKASVARGSDQYTDRKRAAETLAAEFDAKRKQRAYEREEGNWISIEQARSEWNAALAVVSNDVMSIPRDIKPALPAKIAADATQEIERLLRLSLVRISELDVHQIPGINGNGQNLSD